MAAIEAGRRKIEKLLVARDARDEKLADVLKAARDRRIPVERVEAAELDAIAHAKSHGGLVALCEARRPEGVAELDALLARERRPLLLLLEGVDDARDLGSVLRSADALGAQAVLLRKREWDFDETDVMRSSSGAFERLCVVRFDHEEGLVERLKSRGLAVLACVPNVMGTIYEQDLAAPAVVAIGGEKRGLSGTLRAKCTGFMRIPMKAGSTSLTMRDAAAVVLGEAMRQRSVTKAPPASRA
jgi:23S rRNA (guanosine2251-2'-O)-methyltransferase